MADSEAKWYILHTYSGYENKVATDIMKVVENRNLQNLISDVAVPTTKKTVTKDSGKVVEVEEKVYPGYVFVKMVKTDESWQLCRSTRGVTGFVGSGTDPIPLTEEEIRKMGFEQMTVNVDYTVNDSVRIMNGPFTDYTGTVTEINKEKHKVKVLVSMFGRETPVELEFSQVQKV